MTTVSTIDAQAVFTEMSAGWNAADAVRTANTYAESGRLVTPDGVTLDGRDAITAAFTMLFGGPRASGLPDIWAGMFTGTSTDIVVDSVQPLSDGLVAVEATQTTEGPLPPLHITAVLAQTGEAAEILECRPYAFLSLS